MEQLKFLAYLSSEGLTRDEAQNALVLLDIRINDLDKRTQIGPLAQKMRVKWEPGYDGKLVATGEIVEECMSTADFKALEHNIEQLAQARALRSWLSEATRYYDSLIDIQVPTIEGYDNIYDIYAALGSGLNKYAADLLLPILPTPPILNKLDDDEAMATEDFFASMSINDLARYYANQAAAATVGEYIHPEGNYAKARVDLVKKTNHPCEMQDGQTAIKRYTPTASVFQADKLYFELQAQQRDHQKDVNSVKYKAEDAVNASLQQYYEHRQKIETENQTLLKDYNDKVRDLTKRISDDASQLRIALPEQARRILSSIQG